MPKCLSIVPEEVRRRSVIEFTPISLNGYCRSIQSEQERWGKERLIRVHRDMAIIREFESMLNEVKLRGAYRGVEYNHAGPAHLSIGQEAAAVGQAMALQVEDHIYGSHRSHGEILAKGLVAIEQLDEQTLLRVMEEHLDGACLRIVQNGQTQNVKDLAVDFLIYGALAEIFGREAGLNRGMGGSMHAFFTPFGIYPNNAIVGGAADIATGAALFKKINHKPGIVIANIGDASISCGPVWEAMCLASMDQYKKLWDEDHGGGLPLIFNFVNNFYGMGGQPDGETMGFGVLARVAAALNPEQMHAERIDGFNPLAVADSILRKKSILQEGHGPVLLDTITYRFSGHSPSDASSYRTREEVDAWQALDPLQCYSAELVEAEICGASKLEALDQEANERVFKAFRKAVDVILSPRADLQKTYCLLERTMFSGQKVESMDPEREPETLLPLAQNPRVQQLSKRSRSAYDANGTRLPKSRCIGIRDALFEAILDRFHVDSTLVAYGEENRDWGGAFGVYRGLTESLPYHRLFNTPISEGAIVGSAVGYALEGGRALVELMYCDFLGRAGDEILNQLSKWQAMSGGSVRMPVVLRVSVGSKYGAQHSQDWTSLVAHIPGLKVVFPATPYDAKGLMYSALVGTDPVIFFESQRIYDQPEEFVPGGVPNGYYEVPLGEPAVRREGNDLTILTIGAMLYRALEAAQELEQKHGLSCEVIDARSLVPFNFETVLQSVKKTRKILLASDACERGSFLHTLAAKITQFAFDELDAPPVVVGARNWITPPDEVERAFFPFATDIIDAVHEHILPLRGHVTKREGGIGELMRRSSEGI